MRFTRPVLILICVVIMTGCGSGGLLNLSPAASGNIVITNTATGATLQTTLAAPFSVSGGGFSIGITEDHFSGPYTVSITSWTAPFNESCFVSHYVNQTDKTNVVKFSADNAAPVATPTQPSPCNPFTAANGVTQTDEETAQITDGKGHTVNFYYKIAGAAPGGGTGTASALKLALSWSGPSPTGSACGAYVLNVGAVDSNGTTIPTTIANPITLSTTGGGYMGFSAATAASAGFTCPQSGSASPGGTPTLQITASPTQVLVYYNGFIAPGNTTITASSVGSTPATDIISNSASTVVSTIALSWNGAAPTRTNCGAFNLNVKAFNASGAQILSSSYSNPITLSTNSAIWSGFSTVTAGIPPAPAPAALTCGNEITGTAPVVGTPTLVVPNTATPTAVYYDGVWDTFVNGGSTTITASALGVAITTVTIP